MWPVDAIEPKCAWSMVLFGNSTKTETKQIKLQLTHWNWSYNEIIVYRVQVIYVPFLFSYQILTRRSLLPDVANNVPSGLNDMWCTGVAVWHFHTHSHSGSSSLFGVFGSPRSLPLPPISNVTAKIYKFNILLIEKNKFDIHHCSTYVRLGLLPCSWFVRATFGWWHLQLAAGYLLGSMTRSLYANLLEVIQFEPI